jgi:hypothetical protein
MRVDVDGQVFDVPDDATTAEIDAITNPQQMGAAHAAALGVESGIPFASDVHAGTSAAGRTLAGAPSSSLLETLSPLAAGAHLLSMLKRSPEKREQFIKDYRKEQQQRENLRDVAWEEHPWLYGGGKLGGMAATDALVGTAVPAASFSQGISKGARLVKRLLPASRAAAAQGTLYGASNAPTLADVPAGALTGGAVGAVAGPVGELAGAAVSGLASRLNPARAAERNAVRALGAPKSVAKMAGRRGGERVADVGRAMLDEEIPLGSPDQIAEGARNALARYGQAMGVLKDEAAQRGATFDMGRVLKDFEEKATELAKNPDQRPVLDAARYFLTEATKARASAAAPTQAAPQEMMRTYLAGEAPAAAEQLPTKLSPAEGHALRRDLDTFLSGVLGEAPRANTLRKVVMNNVRQSVDAELSRTMDRAGLAREWAAANAGYSKMKDVAGISQQGFLKQVAKEASPGESILKRIRELRLPGPSPATKANAQNALYRLVTPRANPPIMEPGGQAVPLSARQRLDVLLRKNVRNPGVSSTGLAADTTTSERG